MPLNKNLYRNMSISRANVSVKSIQSNIYWKISFCSIKTVFWSKMINYTRLTIVFGFVMCPRIVMSKEKNYKWNAKFHPWLFSNVIECIILFFYLTLDKNFAYSAFCLNYFCSYSDEFWNFLYEMNVMHTTNTEQKHFSFHRQVNKCNIEKHNDWFWNVYFCAYFND